MAERIEIRSLLPPANRQAGETSERETVEKILQKRRRRAMEELDRADLERETAKTEYETRQYERDRPAPAGEGQEQEQLVVDLEAGEPEEAVRKVAKGEPIIISRSPKAEAGPAAAEKGGWSVFEGKPVKDPDGEYTFNQALKVAMLERGKPAEAQSELMTMLTWMKNEGLLGAKAGGGMFESKFMEELAKQSVDRLVNPLSAPPQAGGGTDMLSILRSFGITDKNSLIEFVKALGGTKSEGPMIQLPNLTNSDGTPAALSLDTMERWLKTGITIEGFRSDQRRKDEQHDAVIETVRTVRELATDYMESRQEVAAEAKSRATKEEPPKRQVCECGDCHTQFSVPLDASWTDVKCPNSACGRVYSRAEVLGHE